MSEYLSFNFQWQQWKQSLLRFIVHEFIFHDDIFHLIINNYFVLQFDSGEFIFQLEHSGLKEPYVYKAESRESADM